MADAFDNTHTGFAPHQAESKSGKSMKDRILLCFHGVILLPVAYFLFFVYAYYALFTAPELPTWYVNSFFAATILGHIAFIAFMKITFGGTIIQTLKEIFG